jgi:hypothetical protein
MGDIGDKDTINYRHINVDKLNLIKNNLSTLAQIWDVIAESDYEDLKCLTPGRIFKTYII